MCPLPLGGFEPATVLFEAVPEVQLFLSEAVPEVLSEAVPEVLSLSLKLFVVLSSFPL